MAKRSSDPALRLSTLEREIAARSVALVEALDAELRALRDRRDALNRTIGLLSRKRARYVTQFLEDPARTLLERPAKTVAATLILEERFPAPMRLRDIHAALVRRGWSHDTPRERHALEVAVRALESRGRILRPKRGSYAAAQALASKRVAA
jgi:hypothetical protein